MAQSVPKVIIVGAGPASVEALLALREHGPDRLELELIAPDRDLVVRAYEVLSPFHEGHERRYPLAPIASDLGVQVVHEVVAAVEYRSRTVRLRSGQARFYDALVIAVGAKHAPTFPGATPFRGARDAAAVKEILLDSQTGRHRSVTFVVPGGYTWPLPIYELALHTSEWLARRHVHNVPLTLVSPEPEPLASFGSRASAEVRAQLEAAEIRFVSGHPVRLHDGRLLLAGGRELPADLAIALPRLLGPALPGLPRDTDGYLPVDRFGQVSGVERVFAAGDATTYPVKQGGIATQQADAAADALAHELGVTSAPGPGLTPVLRAVLFGAEGRRLYLYAEPGDRLQESSCASATPLWPQSSKVLGRYLAPYLDNLDAPRSVVRS